MSTAITATGHADFSEDTYRTLCAAADAVMVLDAVEPRPPSSSDPTVQEC